MAIGDVHFKCGEFLKVRDALTDAMHCPGAIGNPYIHLRLGQAQLELSDIARAKDELARAYMGGGEDLFAGEDRKYLEFVFTFLRKG